VAGAGGFVAGTSVFAPQAVRTMLASTSTASKANSLFFTVLFS
jgi:hypothetical protein